MFEDILGEKPQIKKNDKSLGDTRPHSFNEIWEENQRKIDSLTTDEPEYEDLQLDSFELY